MFTSVAKKEGIRGLYRGFTPRLIVSLPGSAIGLVAYEYIKKLSVKPSTAL